MPVDERAMCVYTDERVEAAAAARSICIHSRRLPRFGNIFVN